MQYGEPFKFLLRQRHVVMTLLVGSVMIFIPIVGQIVLMGWAVLVHRALMAGEQEVPELKFDDFSRLLNIGLGPFLVNLLMGLILSVIITPLMFVPMFGMSFLPLMLRGGGEATVIAIFLGVGLVSFVFFYAAVFLFTMAHNAALIRAELNPGTSEALSSISWGYIKGFIKVVKRELFWTAVVYNLLASLLGFLGMICLYIGIFPAAVMIQAAGAHYRAQIYKAYLAKGGSPLPIQPIEGGSASAGAPLPYGGAAPGAS